MNRQRLAAQGRPEVMEEAAKTAVRDNMVRLRALLARKLFGRKSLRQIDSQKLSQNGVLDNIRPPAPFTAPQFAARGFSLAGYPI
jgi:hypothetical protein